jgi:excisionase family DNA binding protein
MSALGAALIDDLDNDDLARLAARLRPFLGDPAAADDRPPEQLLTAAEAAQRARCSVETIRRAVRSGALPSRSVGRAIRIAGEDLDGWLAHPRGERQRPSRATRNRGTPARRPLADALARLETN